MTTSYASAGNLSGLAETLGRPAALGPDASSNALYVVPRDKGDGFQAVVRGHMLELADPRSNHGLAPTPSDLLVASFGAAAAWSARDFLRASELPDDVTVLANWRTLGDLPRPDEIELAVTVSRSLESERAALAAVVLNAVARSPVRPGLHLSLEGAKR
jgi:hypothetical protein